MLGIGARGPLGTGPVPAPPSGVREPGEGTAVSRVDHAVSRPDPGLLAEERQAWVVLATAEGVGDRTLQRIVATHGSARRVLWLAARGRLTRGLITETDARPGSLPEATLRAIERAAGEPGPRLSGLSDAGVWTMTLLDPDYPRRLLSLLAPPPVLFGQGTAAALSRPRAVAIVGTRRASPLGRWEASRAAGELASRGVVVVSGLAVGIDGAAHAAALEAEGVTVAAIGSGHARPGPVAHRLLVGRILERGAVIGELPPAARATKGTYPRRNRLIVALADAVLVVEAPARSGALITAHLAMDQGVPVHVAAGGDRSELSAGCRALLDEGVARTFAGVAALCADLGWDEATGAPAGIPGVPSGTDSLPPLGAAERQVAAHLSTGPRSVDVLLHETGSSPGELAAVLTLLQLRGLARTMGAVYLPAGRLLLGPP